MQSHICSILTSQPQAVRQALTHWCTECCGSSGTPWTSAYKLGQGWWARESCMAWVVLCCLPVYIYHKSCLRAGCSSRRSVLSDMRTRRTNSNWKWPRGTPASWRPGKRRPLVQKTIFWYEQMNVVLLWARKVSGTKLDLGTGSRTAFLPFIISQLEKLVLVEDS